MRQPRRCHRPRAHYRREELVGVERWATTENSIWILKEKVKKEIFSTEGSNVWIIYKKKRFQNIEIFIFSD